MSEPDLLTLRCVNKTLCGLIMPTAFKEIVVRTTETSTQRFLELLANTEIAKHVRYLEFIEDTGKCRLGYASAQYRSACMVLDNTQIHTRMSGASSDMVRKRVLCEVLSRPIRRDILLMPEYSQEQPEGCIFDASPNSLSGIPRDHVSLSGRRYCVQTFPVSKRPAAVPTSPI